MNIKESIVNFVESRMAASVTSVGTVISGVSSAMSWIPELLGYTATIIGIILSTIMIYNQLQNGRIERNKTRLETELLILKLSQIKGNLKPVE